MKSKAGYAQEAAEWIAEASPKLWKKKIQFTLLLSFQLKGGGTIAQAMVHRTRRGTKGWININLSRWRWMKKSERKETILHELAHLYADIRFGRREPAHGHKWRRAARKLGSNGLAKYSNRERTLLYLTKVGPKENRERAAQYLRDMKEGREDKWMWE